eukprot:10213279-Karenia_brevis.AAC.1
MECAELDLCSKGIRPPPVSSIALWMLLRAVFTTYVKHDAGASRMLDVNAGASGVLHPARRADMVHFSAGPRAIHSYIAGCAKELTHRIDKAWKAFYCHRDLLCCKDVSLGRRLRYLEAMVGK